MKNTVLPCVLLIFGVAFLAMGTYAVREGKRSETWPSVDGTIVKSTVRVRRESSAESNRAGSIKPKGVRGKSYYPDIKYTYLVDGTEYEGKRIGFISRGYAFRSKAETAAAEFPNGKSVTVFYDTTSPSESMLQPGGSSLLYLLPAMGVVFLLTAPIAFFVMRSGDFQEYYES